MKSLTKFLFLASLGVLTLAGCSPQEPLSTDGPYVNKVENMSEDFIIGMDSSSVLSLEESGVKYYNFDDEEQDLFQILADNGVNHVRVRIWNDPWKTVENDDGTVTKYGYGGGNVDIDRAVQIGKRVTAAGMKLIANFHYSDFWADPGRQLAPKAWAGMTLDQKCEALYNYTVESMQKFKDNNVDVDIVQIGNETNIGLAGERVDEFYENLSKLITQGTRAVKSVYPNALTAVHFTNPEGGQYSIIARRLRSAKCEYDIFGSSYYPFYHGTLENLTTQLNYIGKTFDKKVMVLETSYANTDEDTDFCGNSFSSTSNYPKYYPVTESGQVNNFRNICNAMVNGVEENRGIGVCYWEGTWISVNGATWEANEDLWSKYGGGWASKYASEYDPESPVEYSAGTVVDNQCFFDKNGKPFESLKMFKYLRTGNRTAEFLDGVETTSVTYMTNENIVLPETVNAIYNNDRRSPIGVSWDIEDPNSLKENGPGTYEVEGTVTYGDKTYDTTCTVTLNVANYARNGDFEAGDDGSWTLTNNISEEYQLKFTNADANNPHSGKWTCHCSTNAKNVNFELTQNFQVDKDITLKLRYFLIGGAGTAAVEDNQQNIYAYIKDGDNELINVPGKVSTWGAGYKSFDGENISLKAGKTYLLGIHVEAEATTFWLDLDDVNLYE